MKVILSTIIALASFQANAISFITEEQVQATLGAEKVIEISKYTVAERLEKEGTACSNATMSKSARAYVVKKGGKALVFVTISSLNDLQLCGEL